MAIASSNATFVSAYSKIGLTPDGSSSYFLPRIIGTRRYTELVLTNRVLSAKEALDWGLINKVVDFKENYLKKMDNNNNRKIFFSFNEDKFKITRFDGINLVKKSIEEISVYEFKNNIFLN